MRWRVYCWPGDLGWHTCGMRHGMWVRYFCAWTSPIWKWYHWCVVVSWRSQYTWACSYAVLLYLWRTAKVNHQNFTIEFHLYICLQSIYSWEPLALNIDGHSPRPACCAWSINPQLVCWWVKHSRGGGWLITEESVEWHKLDCIFWAVLGIFSPWQELLPVLLVLWAEWM